MSNILGGRLETKTTTAAVSKEVKKKKKAKKGGKNTCESINKTKKKRERVFVRHNCLFFLFYFLLSSIQVLKEPRPCVTLKRKKHLKSRTLKKCFQAAESKKKKKDNKQENLFVLFFFFRSKSSTAV